jgi:membrane protein implicated in regulation of membrane protease activity
VGRLLVVIGLLVTGAGLLIMLGVPIGRLPGDIVVRRGSGTFSFPVVTCLIVSVVLTLVMALFRR